LEVSCFFSPCLAEGFGKELSCSTTYHGSRFSGENSACCKRLFNDAKLILNPETFEFSDIVEKDRIIDQDSKAGLSVKQGRKVKIVVSKGIDIGEFPDVEIGQMSKVWIYDFRTNIHFTLKKNPLSRTKLQDFVNCYHPDMN
jgi:hypothetical protein